MQKYEYVYQECHSAVASNGWLMVEKLNTLRSGQNGRCFTDDTFKRIFLNETFRISIKISLKFVPKGPINNNPALVQIMAWRRSGDKPLSEPMMVSLLTHICVTRPQWVNLLVQVMDIHLLGTWPWTKLIADYLFIGHLLTNINLNANEKINMWWTCQLLLAAI